MKNETHIGWFLDAIEMGKTIAYLDFLSNLSSIPKSVAADAKELVAELKTKKCKFYEEV